MTLANLKSSLVAFLLVAMGLSGGNFVATSVAREYVHDLAPARFDQKTAGSALQKEAFRQRDLLPVYGSSEVAEDFDGEPYGARSVFAHYPTGFTVFPVAKAGATSLIIAQSLAAVGSDLTAKKCVVVVTPFVFLDTMVSQDYYAGNFSALHASELAFSNLLSMDVKQAAARRMLAYPATLQKQPLLRFSLQQLADGRPLNRAIYYFLFPLGKLQTIVLRLQDQWETLTFILRQRGKLPGAVARRDSPVDWQALLQSAQKEETQNSNNNPFGFENEVWTQKYAGQVANKQFQFTDQKFNASMADSAEWTDFDVLLRSLREMGAQPLIVSLPINGPFWEAMGVSASARAGYRAQLRDVAARYDMPVFDFADHEGDVHFSIDMWSHMSREGWVYFDQVLNRFYHEDLR